MSDKGSIRYARGSKGFLKVQVKEPGKDNWIDASQSIYYQSDKDVMDRSNFRTWQYCVKLGFKIEPTHET